MQGRHESLRPRAVTDHDHAVAPGVFSRAEHAPRAGTPRTWKEVGDTYAIGYAPPAFAPQPRRRLPAGEVRRDPATRLDPPAQVGKVGMRTARSDRSHGSRLQAYQDQLGVRQRPQQHAVPTLKARVRDDPQRRVTRYRRKPARSGRACVGVPKILNSVSMEVALCGFPEVYAGFLKMATLNGG